MFLEVHEEPSRAKSDAQNALRLELLEPLLRRLTAIDAIVKRPRGHRAWLDLALARKVLQTEAAAILALMPRLDGRVSRAVDLLHDCKGRVILTGMGKSGHHLPENRRDICQHRHAGVLPAPCRSHPWRSRCYRAATMSSSRCHTVARRARSCRLLERIRRLGAKLVAITGKPSSTLARPRTSRLDCSVTEEACPLNLVPTASTTAALAIGDALAMALLTTKGFKEEDFAHLHPGGELGKKCDARRSLMHTGEDARSSGRAPTCAM